MTISQKLRSAQKKIIYAKNERQVNSKLPCKFGHFRRKLNFWVPKTPLLDARGAQTHYQILRPYLFSAHCEYFMLRWPLLNWGKGRGVCISLVGKQPSTVYYYIVSHICKILILTIYSYSLYCVSYHQRKTIIWHGTDALNPRFDSCI